MSFQSSLSFLLLDHEIPTLTEACIVSSALDLVQGSNVTHLDELTMHSWSHFGSLATVKVLHCLSPFEDDCQHPKTLVMGYTLDRSVVHRK